MSQIILKLTTTTAQYCEAAFTPHPAPRRAAMCAAARYNVKPRSQRKRVFTAQPHYLFIYLFIMKFVQLGTQIKTRCEKKKIYKNTQKVHYEVHKKNHIIKSTSDSQNSEI